jgi:hypothetical protein
MACSFFVLIQRGAHKNEAQRRTFKKVKSPRPGGPHRQLLLWEKFKAELPKLQRSKANAPSLNFRAGPPGPTRLKPMK